MTVARNTVPGVPGARAWLGIPFASAERFRSPQPVRLFDLDPAVIMAAQHKVSPRDIGERNGRDLRSMGIVLDTH